MATRVFVTGGSGFIGGALITRLLRAAEGTTVRALARSDRAANAVRALGAEPARGDLEDPAALEAAMRGCETVFHLAASVAEAPLAHMRRMNVEGTKHVLAAARSAGVRRVVHASTEAVLVGSGPLRNVDETRPRPRRPIGNYPRTKAAAEEAALAGNGNGLEVVVVRPRFVWGKGDTTLLPQFVEAVKKGRFSWIGGGRYPTSTTHVENAVEGMLCAATRGRPGEVYFVTDGEPVEFRAFLTAMLATQGIDPGTRSTPHAIAWAAGAACDLLWKILPLASPAPISRTAVLLIGEEVTVRDAKARRELGYAPVITREAGLAAMRA